MATVAAGMTSGYSAILLPQLKLADSPIQIDTEQESWIGKYSLIKINITSNIYLQYSNLFYNSKI